LYLATDTPEAGLCSFESICQCRRVCREVFMNEDFDFGVAAEISLDISSRQNEDFVDPLVFDAFL